MCQRIKKGERNLTEPKQKVGKALSGDVSEIAFFINRVSIQDVALE